MRPLWIGVLATALAAACAHSPAPVTEATHTSPSAHPTTVNPANIKRLSRELPPGYEVTAAASPRLIFGLGATATAQPAPCAVLADPGDGRHQSAQGVSGSGEGGIVDAVVVAVRPGPVVPGSDVVAGCAQWTMSDGHTTAGIRLIEAPRIDGAQTLGMVADVRTSVESGTEIDSRTYTFVAYLGDYYAFTTLTTDPGSMLPPLPPRFAADLLVKTVSTLRG
ncbi:DUF5642 family protein [Mycobacterium ostraviense]|uniref:DUF5642 domain-containing protein n=1 Tax=Mycobacterium ostraviense TaxID=2738409 RepID=A0A164AKN9_9MYCO|nr:DUF5642 family protein [Mycobacterium ostraviense]KZS62579.1 hypothetical protein A4G28_08435 [Mycobacterium ostraviense]UGT92370.1 DUF5642 family protein [Mycobacterium ostraviense]